MRFVKMQGLGNDYIYVNTFQETVADPPAVARAVSDRHFGIGGDGLILLMAPEGSGDVKMRIFNADGSEAQMCGNGVRCVGKLAADEGLVPVGRDRVDVETRAGLMKVSLRRDTRGSVTAARVDMGIPHLLRGEIPMVGGAGERAIGVPLEVGGLSYQVTAVSMGNPHCVTFVPNPAELDLQTLGPVFERHPAFPERVNTEFCRMIDRSHLEMRVWERGSGETLACGTGACASVVAAVLNGLADRKVEVRLLGGRLEIEWGDDDHIYMTGPAVEVFRGEWAGV